MPAVRIGTGPEAEPDDHEALAALVRDDDGPDVDPDTGEPTKPTKDLWEEDPFYDEMSKRPSRAAWALALCVSVVLVIVGGLSFLWGKGEIDGTPVSEGRTIVTETITLPAPAPRLMPGPTVTVTRKSQAKATEPPSPPKTVITTKTIAPQSTLTAYQTLPGIRVTVRATITRTAISEPSVAYLCFRVRRDGATVEIECP